jgi:exosortase C (VPDSG-CTERM-specific)
LKNERQEFAAPFAPPVKSSGSWQGFVCMVVVLLLAFSVPLYELARFAAASDLYSYILLIPFVSGYLVWVQRGKLPPWSVPSRLPAAVFSLGGLAALAGYALAKHVDFRLTDADFLALMMTAFVLFFAGGGCWFLGREIMRTIAFPIGFLGFLVPMPTFLLDGIESFLQQGSALAAAGFFQLVGATFLREGLVFRLPAITLQVAPECSGIHSSLVLFITSSVAGYLFLRSPWKRAVLILAVIPLALLRNGFRVFVIGELCTHVGPEMINSPIHHRGGPLFFALSLIPFFLLLFFLRKSERFDKHSKIQ